MQIPEEISYDKEVVERKARKITYHKTGLPIVFFDIETRQDVESNNAGDYFKLAVVGIAEYEVNGEIKNVEYIHVNSLKELHRVFSKAFYRFGGCIFAAHNVSFDFQVGNMLQWLKDENASIELWYMQMTTTIISGRINKHKFTIIDTMNHWPMSLEKVGAAIGVPKMDIDFNNCSDKYLAR